MTRPVVEPRADIDTYMANTWINPNRHLLIRTSRCHPCFSPFVLKSIDRHFGATLNVGNCLVDTQLCPQMESPKLCHQDEELESLESDESELSSVTIGSHC